MLDVPALKTNKKKPGIIKKPKEKQKRNWDVFTVEGLKVHLKETIIGKRKAYAQKLNMLSDADEYANLDINAVLEKYSTTYPTAFEKNWGYNAIFIDEAQDIKSTELEWIEKLWLKYVPGNKLWMFGDADQNVNKFR
jgi:superfamily I DNA/RNA helicase